MLRVFSLVIVFAADFRSGSEFPADEADGDSLN